MFLRCRGLLWFDAPSWEVNSIQVSVFLHWHCLMPRVVFRRLLSSNVTSGVTEIWNQKTFCWMTTVSTATVNTLCLFWSVTQRLLLNHNLATDHIPSWAGGTWWHVSEHFPMWLFLTIIRLNYKIDNSSSLARKSLSQSDCGCIYEEETVAGVLTGEGWGSESQRESGVVSILRTSAPVEPPFYEMP